MSEQSVIHDLGYQGWAGQRVPRRARVGYLVAQGWRSVLGAGRTWKGKVMPWLIVALMVLPTVMSAGAQLMLPVLDRPFFEPARVPYAFQVLTVLFAATQAPTLFSADLRHRTLVHYLSRPLSRTDYVVARWLSLALALLGLQAVGVLVTTAGWWLDGGRPATMLAQAGTGLLGAALTSAVIAALAGLIAALTPRRGVATAVTTGLLLLVAAVASIVTSVLQEEADGGGALGAWVPALNPFTLVERVVRLLTGVDALAAAPDRATATGMAGALALLVAALVGGLALRYRKVG